MGDLFHEDVPFEYIAGIFGVMAAASWHTFIICTKRVERALEFYEATHGLESTAETVAREASARSGIVWDSRGSDPVNYYSCMKQPDPEKLKTRRAWPGWPLPNLIVLASVENQLMADERIPLLFQIPAAVRGVSLEPLLGPIDLTCVDPREDWHTNALDCPDPSRSLRWVIVGCESGPVRRPMNYSWVAGLKNQCVAAGVPFFLKQAGGPTGRLVKMPQLDGQSWAQMPERLGATQ
jgi:protein gp37